MDQVTIVKNQFRAEQWTELIKECQSSGMRVDDWCKANNVSRHAYYYWLRKLRMATIQRSSSTALVEVSKKEPAVFKKLEVQTPIPNTHAAVIIHLNGATIEVNEGTSNILSRQCFLHCRVYARRYIRVRKHLYRMRQH